MSHSCNVAKVLLLKRVQCFASCIDLAGQCVMLVAKVLLLKICHACCKGFTLENLPRLLQRFYSRKFAMLVAKVLLLKIATFVAKVYL